MIENSVMDNECNTNFGRISNSLFLIIYWIVFIYVSFQIFIIAQHDYDGWIVSNIMIGIFGGIFLIYPFNIIRLGFRLAMKYYVNYLFVCLIFCGIALVISDLIAGKV
jgi:hypothetical protein